jgi:hypothetical protein
LNPLNFRGFLAILVTLATFCVDQFSQRQLYPAPPCRNQNFSEPFCRDAPAIMPMVDNMKIDAQVACQRFPARPPVDDLSRISKCDVLHGRQIVTKSVISQASQIGSCRTGDARHMPTHDSVTKAMALVHHLPPEMRPEEIGKRMKRLRLAYGLKPAQISDILEIPRTYWTRFEKGARPISNEVAWLLIQRFGVTLDWLILGRWDKLPYEVAERIRATPEE